MSCLCTNLYLLRKTSVKHFKERMLLSELEITNGKSIKTFLDCFKAKIREFVILRGECTRKITKRNDHLGIINRKFNLRARWSAQEDRF